MTWIPLLSPKPFSEFLPAEFRSYVRGLKEIPEKGKKKPVKEVSWSKNKKGTLSVKVKRIPKVITPEEIAQIARESETEERLIWIKISAKKSNIKILRGGGK